MHIAFLDANTDTSAFAARHPSEVSKFRALLDPVATGWRYSDHRVTEGALPETLSGFDGLIVSGSPASVNDADDWVAPLLDLLRAAVDRGMPVFGACFGHQAVATALGGRVARNPQGWVLGRVESPLSAPAPWMAGAPPRVALHAAHNEQVVAPPPGATVLGGSEETPFGHLALGSRVFTTQYHPEITRDFMADLVQELDGKIDPAALARARASLPGPVDEALMARWIVDFFTRAR